MWRLLMIEWINGAPHLSRGNIGLSPDQAKHEFSSVFSGEFEAVPVFGSFLYKINFQDPKDELWFKLKYA